MTILQIVGLFVFGYLTVLGMSGFVFAVRFDRQPFGLIQVGILTAGILGILVTLLGIK